ncbi:hypothetical protein FACS189491_04230 [Spirochaetia bacterium]|nr:hypothetical protein FACS189491_04230 [Spirochaetia bacterium]
MDRREFLKKSAALGFGAGLFFMPKGLRGAVELAAQENRYPDLIALKGGTPRTMFERGMRELGGMGRFVKSGQTVVIKPNMSFDLAPEYAANTSPELVAAVVKQCKDAGARRVLILDHSLAHWERASKNSGILDAAKNAGAVYAQAEREGYYQKVPVNGGKRLKEVAVHEALLEADVFINVPVLKHHGGAGVSGSIKNLMGCVWDRRVYHSGLQTCIADFLYVKKPALNIVDAYRVLTRNGPGGGNLADVNQMGSMIISPDIVAADSAAFALVGRSQGQVEYVRIASEAGMGQMDLSKLNISRLTV